MSVDQKIAKHRLGVLELAEALGNVSEACRRRGMTRTQYYDYKRRFQTHGLEGLSGILCKRSGLSDGHAISKSYH